MQDSVIARYDERVRDGRLDADPAQRGVAKKLGDLGQKFKERQVANKSSALGWLFSRKTTHEPLKGLYIWGSVGRGKTMLMDLFVETLGSPSVRRVHFHAFMADVHERIHAWRQAARRGEVTGSDPVAPVAEALASTTRLLCFDEFSVTDIADAMLLGRLFEALFRNGVTVVATSNVEPQNLYRDGLNRALFLPFIALIGERMEVVRLDARTDYRLEKLGGAAVYYTPADAAAREAIDGIFARLTAGSEVRPTEIAGKGRSFTLPVTAQGVVRSSFEALCAQPLAASDYLAIARGFHTVIVENVPVMGQDHRNECKRFITLVDVFYDQCVKLVLSAEAPAQDLYRGKSGAEVFEFDRTVSRLMEMASDSYLGQPHGRSESTSGNTTGLVET